VPLLYDATSGIYQYKNKIDGARGPQNDLRQEKIPFRPGFWLDDINTQAWSIPPVLGMAK